MKEFNKVEETKTEEKQKQPRPYFSLQDSELTELVDTYRKLLRIETQQELIELLKKAVENLERELRLRSKLKTVKS